MDDIIYEKYKHDSMDNSMISQIYEIEKESFEEEV